VNIRAEVGSLVTRTERRVLQPVDRAGLVGLVAGEHRVERVEVRDGVLRRVLLRPVDKGVLRQRAEDGGDGPVPFGAPLVEPFASARAGVLGAGHDAAPRMPPSVTIAFSSSFALRAYPWRRFASRSASAR